MLKYYEYLLKIKVFLKEKYNMDVLENIDDFPLNLDDDNLMEYYKRMTPETEKKILEGLYLRNYKKDAALLAAMQNL